MKALKTAPNDLDRMPGLAMKQGDFMNYIGISLQNAGDETTYLTLSLGTPAHVLLSLSLQDARNLAFSLIQHVHLAEVQRSLKKAAAPSFQRSGHAKQDDASAF
jgi:hypothetical protein